ncbi:MAG: DUF192 domain-containing protein [archaeon]
MRAAVIIALLFVGLSACVSPASPPAEASTIPRVCLGDSCVRVEVVSSPEDRERGLMFRSRLDEDAGMLFVFEGEGIHSFWMKNTYIPLDAIWISSDGRVVDVQSMVPCEGDPCSVYTPSGPSQYVLEVRHSWAVEHGVSVGDPVTIPVFTE